MTAPQSAPMTAKLLPCPLCGLDDARLNPPSDYHRYGCINCPACELVLPGAVKDQGELITCWNTRAAASPRLAGREQIAKAIYQNRRGVSDYIANHDFAIYAKHPHGYDDGRVAIFAAYRDADSILSLLGPAPSESVGSWNEGNDMPKDRPCLAAVDEDWGKDKPQRAYHVARMLGKTRIIGGNFAADLGEDKVVAWADFKPFDPAPPASHPSHDSQAVEPKGGEL